MRQSRTLMFIYHTQRSNYPNLKCIPQIITTIPNTETKDTPYLGTLDPQGYTIYQILRRYFISILHTYLHMYIYIHIHIHIYTSVHVYIYRMPRFIETAMWEQVQSTTKTQRIATHSHIKGLGLAEAPGNMLYVVCFFI